MSAGREKPPLPQQRQPFFKQITLLCHLQKHTFRVGSTHYRDWRAAAGLKISTFGITS